MRKTILPIILPAVLALFWAMPARSSPSLPPNPPGSRSVRPDAAERQKARDLYILTKNEHRSLYWDACLARKAFLRAKQLVVEGYFDHKDPRTGKNPAWKMVNQCFGYCLPGENLVWAGENLAKGMDTPENIHRALMSSATHRKNIMDPHFERIGVGCYDYICVELFAGF